MMPRILILAAILLSSFPSAHAQQPLPGSAQLTAEGDLAMKMLEGMDAYLAREGIACREKRAEKWQRDFSSHEAYVESIEPNRERFKALIGAVDERVPAEMEYIATVDAPPLLAETDAYKIFEVRWPVMDGVHGEGLLIEPVGKARANVVALPDCDTTPEALVGLAPGVAPESQFARRLAESGCRVIVPALIDRRDDFSSNPATRATNQPHREFVNRHAFEMGRHIIGYEVQKVLAAADWLDTRGDLPLGVMGYGEGGLIAFYAAAVDTRIDAACVSGYFQPREGLWSEPIYRNVWALLTEFGDAEIASLVAPRALIVEAADQPEVTGPPPERDRHHGGAPGVIDTPRLDAVIAECVRVESLIGQLAPLPKLTLIESPSRKYGDPQTLSAFQKTLAIAATQTQPAMPGAVRLPDSNARMKRQVGELVEHTQRLMRESPRRRAEFWERADATSLETWQATTQWYRDYFHKEIIGQLPPASLPANPRTRLVYDEPEFNGYEVMLDVHPDVFAYGILLVPKDLKEGERRPVVVCQHGLEGRPQLVADPNADPQYYNRFGAQLAKRGYIVYAPQNPYIHGNVFRQFQRKANPLKLSFFSFIVRQHERTLEWLASLPFVQPDKIAFYGLSYGGKTAMRVPAILPGYCLSICSGDFNEWIWKIVDTTAPFGYPYTHEYEILEWNMGNTFNYAELSWLIMPRPFMVERGHSDGVGIDEWVAYEYARTKRQYDLFNIGDKTEIEYFNGPHEIHGVGTFAFLDKWLK
jgi:dienelactone hydrolase